MHKYNIVDAEFGICLYFEAKPLYIYIYIGRWSDQVKTPEVFLANAK